MNKPGGGGGPFPGAIEVANAPADGYAFGSFVIGVTVVGHQIDIPPLTPAKFDPLGIFLTYPFVIATSGAEPCLFGILLRRHQPDRRGAGPYPPGLAGS